MATNAVYESVRKVWGEDPKAQRWGEHRGADRSAQKGGGRGDLSTPCAYSKVRETAALAVLIYDHIWAATRIARIPERRGDETALTPGSEVHGLAVHKTGREGGPRIHSRLV